MEYQVKVCPVCGDEFFALHHQTYCSGSCRRQARRERVEKEDPSAWKKELRVCPACGKEYLPTNWYQYACSLECCAALNKLQKNEASRRCRARLKAQREALSSGQEIEKKCAWCGMTFKTTDLKERFCSDYCRQQNRIDATMTVEQLEAELQKKLDEASWHCHDCGRVSNTYRCPSCNAKWLKKNGYFVAKLEDA